MKMKREDFSTIRDLIHAIRVEFDKKTNMIDEMIDDESYCGLCKDLNKYLNNAISNLNKAHQEANNIFGNWVYNSYDKEDTSND